MTILIFFLSLFTLSSCSIVKDEITDLLSPLDKTLPYITDYEMKNNSTLEISFSETVMIEEIIINGEIKDKKRVGKDFSLDFGFTLNKGEKMTIALTFSKNNKNTARAFITLYGKNDNIPTLLINEVSIKGTKNSPDRIELLVIKEGDASGVVVTDNISGNDFLLPSLSLNKGDIIVIYWKDKREKEKEEREGRKTTYYLEANMGSTLSGTTGGIIVREEKDGKVMDALLYHDGSELSKKEEELFSLVKEEENWSGEYVSSLLVTSSRVLARLPGAIDTDSSDDWFTTEARKSSFGYENTYSPYSK